MKYFFGFPKLWSRPHGVEPLKPVWRRDFTLDTSQGHTGTQTTKSRSACGTISSQVAASAEKDFLLQDLRLPLQSNRSSCGWMFVFGFLNVFTHKDQVKLSRWIDSRTPTSDNITAREDQSSTLHRRDKSSAGNFFVFSQSRHTLSLWCESNMTKIKSTRTKNKGEQKSTETFWSVDKEFDFVPTFIPS